MQYVRIIWSNTTEQNLLTLHVSLIAQRYATYKSMYKIQAIHVSDIWFVQLFIPVLQKNHIIHTKNIVRTLLPELLDINTTHKLSFPTKKSAT